MRASSFRFFFLISSFIALSTATGCGLFEEPDQGDAPFTFPGIYCQQDGDCDEGSVCRDGKCNAAPAPSPDSGGTSTAGETTGGATAGGEATADNGTDDGTPPAQTACPVDFTAYLALRIDDAFERGPYDVPPRCVAYNCDLLAEENSEGCPADAVTPGAYNQAPYTDLYCCAEAQQGQFVQTQADGSRLYCDTATRHGTDPELAVTFWPPQPNEKIRLTFDLTNDQCKVTMDVKSFPHYYLENTALDASLLITSGYNVKDGKSYQDLPLPADATPRSLNPEFVTSDCALSEAENGQLQVTIDGLPLRFMVALYWNATQCKQVFKEEDCPESFTVLKSGDTAQSYQILPGFKDSPYLLSTGPATQAALVPDLQAGAMSLTGVPLHFNEETTQSELSLVTAFALPYNEDYGAARNDQAGTGQLDAELSDAILSAELQGVVTKLDGTPVKTKEDLTTNCQAGGDL